MSLADVIHETRPEHDVQKIWGIQDEISLN